MKSQQVLAKRNSRYQIIVISRFKMFNMLFRNAIRGKKSSRVRLVHGSRLRRDCITHLPKNCNAAERDQRPWLCIRNQIAIVSAF